MDPSSSPPADVTTFDYTVKVEVSKARFELFETMSYLDLDRLEQADRTRLAIGTVQTDCCREIVYGLTENGMLTAIEFDEDDGADERRVQVDPDTLELVKAASAALGVEATTRKLPIPIRDLMADPQTAIETWQCFRICIFGYCITCCWGDGPLGSWGICSFSSRAIRSS